MFGEYDASFSGIDQERASPPFSVDTIPRSRWRKRWLTRLHRLQELREKVSLRRGDCGSHAEDGEALWKVGYARLVGSASRFACNMTDCSSVNISL